MPPTIEVTEEKELGTCWVKPVCRCGANVILFVEGNYTGDILVPLEIAQNLLGCPSQWALDNRLNGLYYKT